jgi:hypothetical protein
VSPPKRTAAEVLILVSIINNAAKAGAVKYYMEDRLIYVFRAEAYDKPDARNSTLETDIFQGKLLTQKKRCSMPFTVAYVELKCGNYFRWTLYEARLYTFLELS